jgi:hypothetical protein
MSLYCIKDRVVTENVLFLLCMFYHNDVFGLIPLKLQTIYALTEIRNESEHEMRVTFCVMSPGRWSLILDTIGRKFKSFKNDKLLSSRNFNNTV